MRIAIIAEVFLPKVDGVVMRTMRLIKNLGDFGDEVLVICPEAEGCQAESIDVVQVKSFPFPSYPEYKIGLPNKKLVQTIEDFAPDVIHYVNPFAFGFRCYDVFQAAKVDVPNIFSFHTCYGEFVKRYRMMRTLSRVLWWVMKKYHNCAHANLTVSSVYQEELHKRGFERVECWPPAVDGTLYHPDRKSAEMRDRLTGGNTEKRLFLTVSRLAPEKNIEFLADVLAKVPNACLAIVGDGPHRGSLEKRFKELDCRFVGYLKGEELARAYASSDAFLYASETETLGNVLLEAMASGLPVVAPRAGGIPSFVEHNKTGLLFEPRNLNQAVSFAQDIEANDELRKRLGTAARDLVADWDWTSSIKRVREIYQQTAAEGISSRKNIRSNRVAKGIVSGLVHAFRLAPRARLAR